MAICKIRLISCLVFNYVAYYLCEVSFTTVTAIALDRLLALQLHLRYNSLMTTSRVSLVVIGIWLWPGIFSVLWIWESKSSRAVAAIMVAYLVTNFAIYLKIHLIVRRLQTQIQHQQPERSNGNIFRVKSLKKSAVNTFLVFAFLICCYVPQISVLATLWASFTVYYTTITIV